MFLNAISNQSVANVFRRMMGATTPIFQTPFGMPAPLVHDGKVAVSWEGLDGFSPAVGTQLVGTWARPPYPAVCLVGPDAAESAIFVRAVTRGDSQWAMAEGEFTLSGRWSLPPATHTLAWATLVFHFRDFWGVNPVRFAIGDRVAADAFGSAISEGRDSPSVREILRQRVERVYERAGLVSDVADIGDHYFAGYKDGAAAIADRVVSAFALSNCRNVVHEPVAPSQSRASRRRGDLPPYNYHVLKLVAHKAQTRDGCAERGAPLAIHWVRGHFKTYTSERPLFGKLSGVYWWQPTLSGRDKSRVVAKDYQIVAS